MCLRRMPDPEWEKMCPPKALPWDGTITRPHLLQLCHLLPIKPLGHESIYGLTGEVGALSVQRLPPSSTCEHCC